MCGITGIYQFSSRNKVVDLQSTIGLMTDSLEHRGPDSRGTWLSDSGLLALGHRRLSIRDLSSAGNQPMTSSCGRYVIVYNGEVYSHDEIRKDLALTGRRVNGSSDTEIILEACAQWGVENALNKFIGMFAFALYDKVRESLYIVRDRLGIKPVYWGIVDNCLIFGSELKALTAAKFWKPKLDRNALSSFMRHNYIPAPYSIYQGVYKLEPGHLLKFDKGGDWEAKIFWDFRKIAEDGVSSLSSLPENETLDQLDELLSDSVSRRMVADVPLGALLSGGVDSSLVTALMAEKSERRINTFSIGFQEEEFNEAPYASEIAKHLATDHTELYVTSDLAMDLVEKLPYWYDEPFADSSQLPTALVCSLTKNHVTVVLSGDGGDELFAGYSRYFYGMGLWDKANIASSRLRNLIAYFILSQSVSRLDSIGRMLPSRWRCPHAGLKLHQFANSILNEDPDEIYRRMLSHWHTPDDIVIGGEESKGILWDKSVAKSIPFFLDRMQFFDTLTYLPDDILTKVDRASMSVALEVRVPLLDHRLVEFAWSMPRNMKVKNGNGKWALRQLLYKRVPKHLIDRPKMGFGVPFDLWIRGPMRDWVENLLDENRLENQGLFAVAPIRERWQAHLAGENWGYPLWNVLMAQAWIDANPEVEI